MVRGIIRSPALTKYGKDGSEINDERAIGQRNKLKKRTARINIKLLIPSPTAKTFPLNIKIKKVRKSVHNLTY